ncbi:MAG: BON domain-containing protein [Desulfobacteraceae bacterium]|nr:BON domain-containing protein [Desulfobacteraceae bacterium]
MQLSGFVDSWEAAARAVEIAGSVKGVQSVQNNIVVKN